MSELTSHTRYGETLVTPFRPGKDWWTTGRRNSRRTALGATSIVVLLALICWLVWVSPSDNPIRRAVADVVKPIETNMQLKNDRANLLSQLVSQKSTMSNQSAKMADQTAALDAALGKAKALEAELSAAKKAGAISAGKVMSYKAQLAALKASVAARAGHTTLASGSAGAIGGHSSTGAGTGTGTGTGTGSGAGSGPPTPIGPVVVSTPTKAQIVSPVTRYFGLYTAQSPFSFSEFNEVASQVGKQPNVSGYFQGWDQTFRADAVQDSWAKGDLPLMTWESQSSTAGNNDKNQAAYSLSNIIEGKFDSYLTTYADAIVANRQPLAIRLDQEMNATWYPWSEGANGNTAGQFVQMWTHVHDIFQARGANSYVIWDWSPNRVDNLPKANKTAAHLATLYPGDSYVDWVGMSGYERPTSLGVQQDGSFQATFGATLADLRALAPSKKIILSEIGAAEEGAPSTPTTPSLKQAWITNLFDALADPANSDIIGFSWFNLTVTTNVNQELASHDWRITSTAPSIAAFTAGIGRTDTGFALRSAPQQ